MTETAVFAELSLLPDGWERDVLLKIGPDGGLTAVTAGAQAGGAVRAAGPVLPGLPWKEGLLKWGCAPGLVR